MDQGLTLGASRFAIHFPIFLVGVWLFASLFVGFLSSWFTLVRRYPNHRESATSTLRFCSARLGACNFTGCLRFEACPSGLRVAISPLIAPLERPFFVPWPQISVHATSNDVTLHFGIVAAATVSQPLALALATAAYQSWPAAAVLLAHPIPEPLIGIGAEERVMISEPPSPPLLPEDPAHPR